MDPAGNQQSRGDGLPRGCGNCLLRRLSAEDLRPFQAYRSDPQAGQFQGWEPLDDAAAAEFLARMAHAEMFVPGVWQQLGIATPEEALLIGDIGICLSGNGRQAEVGITLNPDWQGHGIATAAFAGALDLVFERTSAERVVAITDSRNTPSIRLLERVGMARTKVYQTRFRDAPCVEIEFTLSRPAGVLKPAEVPSR